MKTLVYTTVFFVTTLIALLPLTSNAQSYIDEDFITNLDKNTQTLWAVQNNYFQLNNVPEKYKDESGVIIGFKRDLSIDKKSSGNFLVE